jgi:signal transduction histidine kinase
MTARVSHVNEPPGIVRRALRNLRLTVFGPDPAPPAPLPFADHPASRFLAPVLILLLLGLVTLSMNFMDEINGVPIVIGWAIGALVVAPLTLLWRSPLWAGRLVIISALLTLAISSGRPTPDPIQIVVGLATLAVVGYREPTGVAYWIGGILMFIVVAANSSNHAPALVLTVAAPLVIGDLAGRWRKTSRTLEAQRDRGELAEARQVILQEQTRIARELHDVVAHSMSMLAVRAETAPYRLPDLPGPVREEFLSVAAGARDALRELRQVLGVLRTGDDAPALRPAPTLGDILDLVGAARAAGVLVDTAIVAEPVPAAVGQAGYRIVQEALSNVARHAPGTQATVRVSTQPAASPVGGAGSATQPSAASCELRIEVHNGPGPSTPIPISATAATAPDATSSGHGLVGMRERAHLLGGTLHAAPTPDGGFEVLAVLPCHREGQR